MHRIKLCTYFKMFDCLGVLLLFEIRQSEIILDLSVFRIQVSGLVETLGRHFVLLKLIKCNPKKQKSFRTLTFAQIQLVYRHLLEFLPILSLDHVVGLSLELQLLFLILQVSRALHRIAVAASIPSYASLGFLSLRATKHILRRGPRSSRARLLRG